MISSFGEIILICPREGNLISFSSLGSFSVDIVMADIFDKSPTANNEIINCIFTHAMKSFSVHGGT